VAAADETSISGRSRPSGDDLSIASLLGMIWRRRRTFFAGFVLPVILALIYLHVATYKYRADMGLAPPQTSSSGNARVSLGNLGGLESLAGVNIGSQGGGLNFQLYKEAVYERETAEKLAANPWLMQAIFDSDWDPVTQRWREPIGMAPSVKHVIFTILGTPDQGWRKPDAARLEEFIVKNVTVSTNSKSPVMRLSILHRDPQFAIRFLNAIHLVIDSGLRRRLLSRTTENIEYLSTQLVRTQLAEHRQALVSALGEQERLRMTASSTVAFAAEPFGAASATRLPETPNGPIVIVIALVVGVAFGAAAALGTTMLRR